MRAILVRERLAKSSGGAFTLANVGVKSQLRFLTVPFSFPGSAYPVDEPNPSPRPVRHGLCFLPPCAQHYKINTEIQQEYDIQSVLIENLQVQNRVRFCACTGVWHVLSMFQPQLIDDRA